MLTIVFITALNPSLLGWLLSATNKTISMQAGGTCASPCEPDPAKKTQETRWRNYVSLLFVVVVHMFILISNVNWVQILRSELQRDNSCFTRHSLMWSTTFPRTFSSTLLHVHQILYSTPSYSMSSLWPTILVFFLHAHKNARNLVSQHPSIKPPVSSSVTLMCACVSLCVC